MGLEQTVLGATGKTVKKLAKETYINQNLLVLVFALAGLAFVEIKGLRNESVKIILLVLSWASLFSVLSSLLAYSINYWNKKSNRINKFHE